MESRLPKPRIPTRKGTESTTVKKDVEPTVTMRQLGRAKTAVNVELKKENKPPLKVASTTIPAGTKTGAIGAGGRGVVSTMNTRSGIKRAATVPNNINVPAKRPNLQIRPTASKPGTSGTATSGKSLKPATTAPAKAVPNKVNRWDFKTKLEKTSQALTSTREKNKAMQDQFNELQTLVKDLNNLKEENEEKITNLEATKTNLTEELINIKEQLKEATNDRDKLEEDLKKTQESLDNVSASLKQFETLNSTLEKLTSEQSAKIKDLEINLETEIKIKNNFIEKVSYLQNLMHQMDKDRRILHNTIQEMKGNIRVFCRIRPKIPKESDMPSCIINYIDECTLEIGRADGSDLISYGGKVRGTKQEFSFDKVFPPTASQATIFEELSLLVQSAIEGYNVCVFAYGQTGSGKTYTMEGGFAKELEGMIPRTVRHIFQEMKEFEALGWEYKIEASFLEIYNEHIVDLLDSNLKSHEIRMADSKGSDLYVTNLQVANIESPEELNRLLRVAQQNRAVAATKSNERSSRSHSVARIRLIGTHAEKEEKSVGNLNLVDLAGSERLRGEESARTTETKNINKSLANLGNVILALLKKQEHIPYRNSKLTHLLMPSLGGNSKTLMLLNISPLDACYNETLNSLRFGSNVNSCKIGNVKRTRTMIQNSNNTTH